MTLNVQSLNSKYDDLVELIALLNVRNSSPDILCLQELWQFPDDADFNIPGYSNLVYKLRRNNVQGGGVGIFVKSDLHFSVDVASSIFVDRIFESILLEVTVNRNKKILVASLYRPATNHPTLSNNDQFIEFMDLFTNLLSDLSGK